MALFEVKTGKNINLSLNAKAFLVEVLAITTRAQIMLQGKDK